jgi:hypothetical protein
MVKVVGYDSTIAKRITCGNCGAINEYLPTDVRELYRGRDYSGCGEGRDGFNCGNDSCGKEITTRSW